MTTWWSKIAKIFYTAPHSTTRHFTPPRATARYNTTQHPISNNQTKPMNTELSTTSPTTAIYDPQVYDQLAKIAQTMAHTSLIPDSLTKNKEGAFPIEKVAANCFLIAEQAHRWGMSPFAVAQSASVVHGRLMWEGKLVAAVIETNAGVRLNYEYEGTGLNRRVTVSGKFPDEENLRTVSGTVSDWKTDQWKASDYDQRLAYRGAREWARRHSPGVMLGVLTDDEALPAKEATVLSVRTVAEETPTLSAPTEAVTPSGSLSEPQKPDPKKLAPAHVIGATKELDGYVITLKGTKGEHVVFADMDNGSKAEHLVGCEAMVNVSRRNGCLTLLEIQPSEGGEA